MYTFEYSTTTRLARGDLQKNMLGTKHECERSRSRELGCSYFCSGINKMLFPDGAHAREPRTGTGT